MLPFWPNATLSPFSARPTFFVCNDRVNAANLSFTRKGYARGAQTLGPLTGTGMVAVHRGQSPTVP